MRREIYLPHLIKTLLTCLEDSDTTPNCFAVSLCAATRGQVPVKEILEAFGITPPRVSQVLNKSWYQEVGLPMRVEVTTLWALDTSCFRKPRPKLEELRRKIGASLKRQVRNYLNRCARADAETLFESPGRDITLTSHNDKKTLVGRIWVFASQQHAIGGIPVVNIANDRRGIAIVDTRLPQLVTVLRPGGRSEKRVARLTVRALDSGGGIVDFFVSHQQPLPVVYY